MEKIKFKLNESVYIIDIYAGGNINEHTHHSLWTDEPRRGKHTAFLIYIYCAESPLFRINGVWSKDRYIKSAIDYVDIALDSTKKEEEILTAAENRLEDWFKSGRNNWHET